MGLFKKKKKKDEKDQPPKLSQLPKLPEIPPSKGFEKNRLPSKQRLNQLPSFPKNSFGEKFSQDTIKSAISVGKRGEERKADEFAPEQMMQKSLLPFQEEGTSKKRTMPLEKIPGGSKEEPIFIRIDRFKEAMQILEEVKKQNLEIKKMLDSTKKIKEEEGIELKEWEEKVENLKKEIEDIDNKIFSKVE